MKLDLLFSEQVQVFEQVPFDGHIQVIISSICTRLAWMMNLVILMHSAGLNAEFEPYVLELEGVKVYGQLVNFGAGAL